MLIYSGTAVIWDSWILISHPPVSFVPSLLHWSNQYLWASNDNNAIKTNITVILIINTMSVIKHKQNINLQCQIIVQYPLASDVLVSVQIWSNVRYNSLKHIYCEPTGSSI